MILFVFIAVGILVSTVRSVRSGGKLNLEGVSNIRVLWLPVLGFLLHGLIDWAPSFALRFTGLIMIAYYFCIFCFLYYNREVKIPSFLMALGSVCNFSVIAANGFLMPISPMVLAMYPGMTPEAVYVKKINYFVAVNGANLYPLGDVIPVPLGSLGGFASVGDLLLGVGLMLFIIRCMNQKSRKN